MSEVQRSAGRVRVQASAHPRSVAGVRLIVAMWALAVVLTSVLVTVGAGAIAIALGVLILLAGVATVGGILMIASGRRLLARALDENDGLICPGCHYALKPLFASSNHTCSCPECGREWDRASVLRAWRRLR